MTIDISEDSVSQDCVNVVKWRQCSITYFSVNYTKKRGLYYITDFREQLGIHTQNVYTLLGYEGHREISTWREQIIQEVGEYIERTERFKLAQAQNFASQ